ncbi:UDP pyrophosphate phosphatase [Trinickia caryophylli]|nr:UDP pyrophosphate phosphatase [Trinickia caryophylli]WQE11490.1 UDP pyrophosphate phosphatase [Trinickia caryophylli]
MAASHVTGVGMDLAMAMALAMFGMFAGSTALFFYRIGR